MKKFNKKKLKVNEFEEELYTIFNPKYLNKILEWPKSEDLPITKLLENSQFLSEKIFYKISKLNLKQEIPFNNLEINILSEFSRTISDEEKFFVMFQVCALSIVCHSIEVPYIISLIGDSKFLVILKDIDEEHSFENLQKVLDCIFIKRYNTNILSCLKNTINKFKTLNNDAQRVFYIFTNVLNKDFCQFKEWEKLFTNNNIFLSFILSKFKIIKKEEYKDLSFLLKNIGKYCESRELPIKLIEITEEKLYIKNKGYLQINEENIEKYIKDLTSVLIVNDEKENNYKIAKPIFKIERINNFLWKKYF